MSADPSFRGEELRTLKGDFVMIRAGYQRGLKNVLIIGKDGSVRRMAADPAKIRSIAGSNALERGGAGIVAIDTEGAEILVPPM